MNVVCPFQVNHIDIAPNFAGTLMGITNGVANIMSIIAPLLVGFIVTDQSDATQWRYVFFISAGIYFFGNLIFVLFSSTDIQAWNDLEHRDRRKFKISNSAYTYINICIFNRIRL